MKFEYLMEIRVADQRILLFSPKVPKNQAQTVAWEKKISAFDALSKFGSFLSKPKDDDFEIIYSEFRYESFWHVIAHAHYVYDRTGTYQVKAGSPVVRSVSFETSEFEITNGQFHIPVMEHCTQEEREEVLVEGATGKVKPELKKYLTNPVKQMSDDLKNSVPKDSIFVPPQTRISAIMRDALAKMIKGIQADKIVEEKVEIECSDLYWRPVYAFKIRWKSKNKEAIVEVDAITEEVTAGNRTFQEFLGKTIDKNFLFDIGADAAGIFIPGGNIAVKIAKKYIDTRKNK